MGEDLFITNLVLLNEKYFFKPLDKSQIVLYNKYVRLTQTK